MHEQQPDAKKICWPTLLSGCALLLLFVGAIGTRLYGAGATNSLDPRGDAFWKLTFLKRQAWNPLWEPLSFHDPHATRGWTPKLNLREPNETTNNRGQRSTEDYRFAPDKFRIMTLGDSFTYGQEAGDGENWPACLQKLNPRFQVVNLGVCGYGVDQMYITQRETIDEYKPHLVIFAPNSDDFYRSLLSFREYAKPRFRIEPDQSLRLTNTPVPNPQSVCSTLREQYGWLPHGLLEREDQAFRTTVKSGSYHDEWTRLNTLIVEEAIRNAQNASAVFMLIHLDSGEPITWREGVPSMPNDVETFLMPISDKYAIPFVPMRKFFVESRQRWHTGHYRRPEAEFVAQTLAKHIEELPVWKEFTR